jgi:ssDNA-binding Zn-finger/Zn-ribbon topoisomerase 1
VEQGGFTERMYAVRTAQRASQQTSDKSDMSDASDLSDVPLCPKCNKAMLRRTARTGARSGQALWGCSDYPRCDGIRRVEASSATPPVRTRKERLSELKELLDDGLITQEEHDGRRKEILAEV